MVVSKGDVLDWKTNRITKKVVKIYKDKIALSLRRGGGKPSSVEEAAINEIFCQGLVFARDQLLRVIDDLENELVDEENNNDD